MATKKENGTFEVLNPWADADPIPLKGLAARVTDLAGKRVGLFRNSKRAAPLILSEVRDRLKEKFPTLEFSPFTFMPNAGILETDDKDRFEEYIRQTGPDCS